MKRPSLGLIAERHGTQDAVGGAHREDAVAEAGRRPPQAAVGGDLDDVAALSPKEGAVGPQCPDAARLGGTVGRSNPEARTVDPPGRATIAADGRVGRGLVGREDGEAEA